MVQYQMAPVGRRVREDETIRSGDYKPSAVLIVMCRDSQNRLFIPLIERQSYNGVHSGQVGLPGGKFDSQDMDLAGTALRECREEIGLVKLELIGELSRLFIPVSRFMVQPFVAYCSDREPSMQTDPREVKSLLRLYVDDLMTDEISKKGEVSLQDNSTIIAPYFTLQEYKIWGATAMIINELKGLVKPIF